MKLQLPFNTQNTVTIQSLAGYVSANLQKIQNLLNGNVTFGDNITSKVDLVDNCATDLVTGVFSSASTIGIPHNLGKVPRGYILVSSSAAINLSNGSHANTTSTLYLTGSAASKVTLLVF